MSVSYNDSLKDQESGNTYSYDINPNESNMHPKDPEASVVFDHKWKNKAVDPMTSKKENLSG